MIRKTFIVAFILALWALVQTTSAQTREETTIQNATADLGKVKGAINVQYLNFPWGEVTFSYIEHGTKGSYYGERNWPFAQLDTKVPLNLDGTKINPGQYALVISPGSEAKPMSLSLVQFEGETFLKAGNVFSPVPKGDTIYSKDITFETVDTTADHMKIDVNPTTQGVDLIVDYGNRRLEKSFTR